MSLSVSVDRELCIGAGSCVRIARGVFVLDEEGIAVALDPAAADADDVLAAARSCPAAAIAVEQS